MKMRLRITLVAVWACFSLNAQWTEINTLGEYETFHFTMNKDTAFFVGFDWNYPYVYRTLDGGQTMDTSELNQILFSWPLDIDFPSPNVGYLCGGTAFGVYQSPILKTSDGGENWDTLVTNRFGYELTTVDFIDEQIGFFGGIGQVVKTTDGGNTFTVYLAGDSASRINDMHFKDANTGFILQRERIYKTINGGLNWAEVFADTSSNIPKEGVAMSFPQNGSTGYVVNIQSGIIKTTDNGDSWQYVGTVSDSMRASSIEFTDALNGYVGTLDPMRFDRAGRIYKTSDGGQTWQEQYRSTPNIQAGPVTSIGMANGQVGYAMMGNNILKTVNGGIGLMDFEEVGDWKLFPNPARDYFRLEIKDGVTIEKVSLLDINGRKLQEWRTANEEYALKELPPGLYFVKVEANGTVTTGKIRLE